MRWEGIYLKSCATELGRTEQIRDAVAEGRYDAKEANTDGYLSVSVVNSGPAVELAVKAAELAMGRSAVSSDAIRLILHSSCHDQGLNHFAPASYVQSRTIGGRAAALEVKQYSNGGLAALEIAAAYLMSQPEHAAVLLTTSDIFALPSFDRYRSDKGVVFGDGATGVVLARTDGVARLLSTSVISDGTYGAVYIGDESWVEDDGKTQGGPVDLRERREKYLAENSDLLLKIVQSMTDRQRECASTALSDAGLTSADISRWVLTNVGLSMADVDFLDEFGIDEERTTWEWGRRVGHIGSADQIAGLTHLLESGAVRPGDRVALCGVGMGFTYTCAVVEILDSPEWSASAGASG